MVSELSELKRKARENPDSALWQRQLARHYLENGQYKSAKEKYYLAACLKPQITAEIILDHEALLQSDLKNLQIRLSLISFYFSFNHLADAVLELQELILLDPKNLTAYNLLGKVYVRQEKLDEVLELLESALSLGLKDLSLSELLASVYLEKGRVREAIKFYEDIGERLAGDKRILRILGDLYTRVKDYDLAADRFAAMFSEDAEVAVEIQKKLEELLDRDPGSVRIREALAEVYRRGLKPDLAVKKLEEAVSLDPSRAEDIIFKLKDILKNYPNHPEASFALAAALIEKESFTEAIELYQKLIQSHPAHEERAIFGCKRIIEKLPGQIMAHQFLAETYVRRQDFAAALKELKDILLHYGEAADWVIGQALPLATNEPAFHEALGYAFLLKRDFTRASREAETRLFADRKNIAAYLLIAEVNLQQKLCKKALLALQTALSLDPYNKEVQAKFREAKHKEYELEGENIKKRLIEDEWRVSLHLDLARVYLNLDQAENARAELQAGLKDQLRAPFIYETLGKLFMEEGRFDLAVINFKKGLEASTSEPLGAARGEQNKKLLYHQALAYEAQGQIKPALKILDELQEKDLGFAGLKKKISFLKKTSLNAMQNRMLIALLDKIAFWGREAKAGYRKEKLEASFGLKYNNSGLEYFMKGMVEASQEQFALAAQLDPDYVAGVNNLGITLLLNNKLEESLFKFRAALNLEPNSALVYNNLGVVFASLGSWGEAQKHLEKALEIDADLSVAWINLGDVCYGSDQVKKAIECYRRVKETDLLAELAKKKLLYKVPA